MKHPLTVFIADDSALIRERLVEMIGDIDGLMVVGMADDVPTAQDGIRVMKPDVAIVDLRMPGGTGLDVVRGAKTTQESAPSVIVYSNYALPQYRKICHEAGADFCFDKSTETQCLPDALRSIAARHAGES